MSRTALHLLHVDGVFSCIKNTQHILHRVQTTQLQMHAMLTVLRATALT